MRHAAVAIAALHGSFQRLRRSSALPGAPKTQSCETNNANTRAQQWGGLSQICASFRQNPCSTHGCLNQATAPAAPNLAAQLPAPGHNPYGMSTPRGHAGAFTKRTWFYTTRLASSLPGCPGSDDEANTIRASRTQRLSTQKKRPSPRPGEEAGPGTSQVDRIEIISLPTSQIPFCECPHRAKSAVFERQQQFCCI